MYKFHDNLKVKKYGSNTLLFEPNKGSWCFLNEADLKLVNDISKVLDSSSSTELNGNLSPALETLYSKGIVSKNNRFIYDRHNFDHSRNKVNTLILKVVGFCNLACSYCYDYNEDRYKLKMSLETAKLVIDSVWDQTANDLKILFHGGEPMLARELIVDLIEYTKIKNLPSGKRITYSIQTNGTLLDDEWANIIRKYDISVGLSLDGYEEINDRNRFYHNGKGSFNKIISNLLKYPDILRRVGVLTVVTQQNVSQLFEIGKYFQKLGINSWKTILYQPGGRSPLHEGELGFDSIELVESYIKLFKGIEKGEFDDICITSILSYINNVLFYERDNMCLRSTCGAASDLVSISVDGTIEACDCITNLEYRLGKLIDKDSIAVALNSKPAKLIRERSVDSLYQCKSCDWKTFCGGTCLAKAGRVDKVDPTECVLSINMFELIFQSLSESPRLIDYANKFNKRRYIE